MSQVVNVNERLAALTAAGTSPWLDQIRRSLTQGGELRRMIEEDSLRGVTSNPAIFEKAILGSPDYDEQIEELARGGALARAIYQEIAIQDVREAADVLRPVFDELDGDDGYVSLEVDPDLAFDSDRTIAQAREYWARVDRPNAMIKIPGTTECLPAIEQAIFEGINVNVTLLFSVEAYAMVADAYIRGLKRRRADGKDLDVRSVASFFVSRVDSEVDKRLEAIGRGDLQGQAAVANARAAYRRFEEIFHGERFAELRAAGAHVQRPLWASTGVKNPHYKETKYVEELVGPDTVNTMPMQTLLACAERLEVTGETVREDPAPVLEELAAAGIDMDDVTDKLLREGIDAFVTPMEKLLAGVEAKREAIFTGRPETIDSSLPDELEPLVHEFVKRAEDERVARRIWSKDDTLWGAAGQAEVTDRLGWLAAPDTYAEQIDDLEAFASDAAAAGFTDAVLLGMGGSSLAPEVLRRSFGDAQHDRLRLHVIDSTDPAAVLAQERAMDLEHTLFLVSTKSGGTIETIALFEHFWSLRPLGEQYVAITDPGSSLEALAVERGFRRTFLNDPDVGGRYSALTYFGLVPAALMGIDLDTLLAGAGVAAEACSVGSTADGNSGLWLGAALAALALQGHDKLTFVIDGKIASLGLWVEQLVAESLGKEGKGIVPVTDEPLGRAGGLWRRSGLLLSARQRRPQRRARRARPGARRGRPADGHAVSGRPRRPGPDLLLRRVRDRGRRLGAGHQPVRPARRAGRQGHDWQAARRDRRWRRAARARRRRRRRPPRAHRRGDARVTTSRSSGSWRPARRWTPRWRSCARRSATRRRRRRRSATAPATCIRPASCTRAVRGPAASSCSCRTAPRMSRSPAGRSISECSRPPRPSATSRRCAAGGVARRSCEWAARTARRRCAS